MTILAASQAEPVLHALRGASQVLGHTILEAQSSTELMLLLPAYHPDVVLIVIDGDLPGAGGQRTLKQVKSSERYARIPVLILTMGSAESEALEAVRAGAADTLARDCTQQDLVTRMLECLSDAA